MERNGRWLNWAALIVGGLALFFALGGRHSQPTVNIQVPNGAAVAPGANDPRGGGPGFSTNDDRNTGPGFGAANDARGNGPGSYGPMAHRPHFGIFGFFGGILKFFGFLLLIGLAMRFFFGRRGGPPWRRGWGGPPWQGGNHPGCHKDETPAPAHPEQRESGSDETPPSTGETVRL